MSSQYNYLCLKYLKGFLPTKFVFFKAISFETLDATTLQASKTNQVWVLDAAIVFNIYICKTHISYNYALDICKNKTLLDVIERVGSSADNVADNVADYLAAEATKLKLINQISSQSNPIFTSDFLQEVW